jgi:DNA repair exonuclease SbcCD ATPase subunit
MLKSLILVNYGPHKHTVINFYEGNTYITGDNGSGKTFITEALYTLLYNNSIRPHDIKTGESYTEITVVDTEFELTKTYDLKTKTHTTSLTKNGNTTHFTGTRGYDDDILPITKCATIQAGTADISSTFVKVTEQIMPYLYNPKNLLLSIVGKHAQVDFRKIVANIDANVKLREKRKLVLQSNIEVLERHKEVVTRLTARLVTLNAEYKELEEAIDTAIRLRILNKTIDLQLQAKALQADLTLLNTNIDSANREKHFRSVKVCPTCNRVL